MTETKLQIKKIVVRDLPRITKYLNKTDLKDKIQQIMFPKEEMKVTSWAELREELDLELEELKDIQSNTDGNLLMALRTTAGAEHLVPKRMTADELGQLVFQTIYDVIDDEEIFKETVSLLAYLYEEDVSVIEELGLKDLREAVEGVIKDQDFLS